MNPIKFIQKCRTYHKRVQELMSLGWYKNLDSGFCERHCMGTISKKRLFNMTDKEFERVAGWYL